MVDQLRPGLVATDVDLGVAELGLQLVDVPRPDAVGLERLRKAHALPRPGEIDLVPTEGRPRAADRRLRGAFDERLAALHRVAVVGVGLVPLDLRELRRVLVRVALVAKVLRELVDLLEAADDQSLEIELVGDAEVEVLVEQVRAGDERLGEPAAVAWLQDRRLNLDEALAVEVGTDCGDHAGSQERVAARLLVHQQVEVALPVAGLGVGDAVERIGERAADLGEQGQLVDGQRRLAAPCLRRRAFCADQIAEVEVDLARAIGRAEELDAARAVDEVKEDDLAHVPPGHDPAGQAALRLGLLAGLERLGLGADRGDLVPVGEALGQRGHAASLRRAP